jgi:O-antigen/teichoic acid export membrane protein
VQINTAFAQGDLAQVRNLVAKSNGGAAFLLLPVAGGLFSVAPELVRIVYTEKYSQTAPIMQVYLLGMMLSSFAVGHLLPALNKGRFATLNNALCLPVSVLISMAGVHYLGMLGAALGSVLMLAVSEFWSACVVAATLQTRVAHLLALRALVPSCLATAAGMLSAWLVGLWLPAMPLLLLLSKGAVYALVALAVLLLSGGKPYLLSLLGRK